MRSRDITTRSVASTRSWLLVAAYAVAMPVFFVIAIWAETQSNLTAGSVSLLFGGILLFFMFGAPYGLFKDSIYLREVNAKWKPEWWKYLLVGCGIPLIGGITAGSLAGGVGLMVTAMLYLFLMWATSAYYIYKRHERIGVP